MKGKTLSCLIFILFIGITLLPATLATEKEATPEPLNQTITIRGIIYSETWTEDEYEGYTFVQPIFVTDGGSFFTRRNCEGIGIPNEDFDESTYSLFYQPHGFLPAIMPKFSKLIYIFTLGDDKGPIIL